MAKQMEQQQTGGPGYDIPCYDLLISPPSYSGRSVGPGYDIPWYDLPVSPPSYSGRSGGPGYDIPWYDLPMSPSSYSGRSGGPGYDIPYFPPQYIGSHCYRAKLFVRRYSGGDGTALPSQQQPAPRPFSSFVRDQRYNGGHNAAPSQQPAPRPFSSFLRDQGYSGRRRTAPQQQPAPRPFSSVVRDQRYNSGHSAARPQQPAPGPFSSFGWDQRYNGGHSTAPPPQPRPRPFSSFGWDQRYAYHSRPPVNGGLANNIAQGQAQRDDGVDDRAEQQRPTTEIDCYGGPVPEVSGPPEATAPSARGGLPLQARRQRRLQPPSGTLSPPTGVILDSAFEEWLQSDNMEMSMFSQSEGPQQSAPTAVTLAAAAPAAEAVTGTRVFPAVSSKGVAEAPASSVGVALAAVPAAAPATGDTVFPTASVGGGGQGARFCRWNSGIDGGRQPGVLFPLLHQLGGRPLR